MKPDAVRSVMEGVGRRAELAAVVAADLEAIHCRIIAPSLKTPDDLPQYPLEVLNRAADIFRMAGHMLGQPLLLCPGLVVSVDYDPQPFPRRRD